MAACERATDISASYPLLSAFLVSTGGTVNFEVDRITVQRAVAHVDLHRRRRAPQARLDAGRERAVLVKLWSASFVVGEIDRAVLGEAPRPSHADRSRRRRSRTTPGQVP